jgi:aminopeptidase N
VAPAPHPGRVRIRRGTGRSRRWPGAAQVAVLVAALAAGACTGGGDPGPDATEDPSAVRAGSDGIGDPYFPGYGNGGYDVTSYRLELRYDPGTGRLDGHELITAAATADLSSFNLDFGPLDLGAVRVDGAPAEHTRPGGSELVVTPARGLRRGHRFTVEVDYGGTPGSGSDDGFLRSAAGAVVVGEPEGATSWFAVNDHPLDKAAYSFAVTVPDGWMALANGAPVGPGLAGTPADPGWRTWRWSQPEPMASYLATVAIGRFRLVTGEYRGLPVVSAVAASLPASEADAAIARTPEIVDFLADRFGPYPFGALGGIVPDEPRLHFALETQTRPVYAAGFFRRGSVADKTSVIAHELAHQWYGDSVSVHYWRDIWLNEGFATYGQWMWDEHVGGASVHQQFEHAYTASVAGDVWNPPPGDPGAAKLFGTSVYVRGAMTLHALRLTVGDLAFFEILRSWAGQRRYGNGSTEDFVALAEEVAGRALRDLLEAWLFRPGKPPVP